MPVSIRAHRRLPLAYLSGFLLLTTLQLLTSGPADAEWVEIGRTDNATVYIDTDTILRKGELVKMWALYDFKTVQYVVGVPLLSSKEQNEYDCAEERLRGLAMAEFTGNLGTGTMVYTGPLEGTWIPVGSQGVDQALWRFACGKK